MAASFQQDKCPIDLYGNVPAHLYHHAVGIADFAQAARGRLRMAGAAIAPHRYPALVSNDIHGEEGSFRSLKPMLRLGYGALLPIKEAALVDPFVEAEIPHAEPAFKVAGIDLLEIVFCPRHNNTI